MSNKSTKMQSKALESYLNKMVDLSQSRIYDVSYNSFLGDKYLVARAVKTGVTKPLFQEIRSTSPFDDKQWSDFLNINVRTLQRYNKAKEHTFKPIQSEKIFELAEVINAGYEIFDTSEDFNIWLNTASPALGNEKPFNLLDSSYGKDLVLSELNRIEHGIFV